VIYPDYETYNKLYGRYLVKSLDRFFTKMDPKGKHILDLCAGGGHLTQYALDHGAEYVRMVDKSFHMCNPTLHKHPRVTIATNSVEGVVHTFDDEPFDMVLCRQGINYWLKQTDPEKLAKLVKRDGMFVFNTFGNKPPEEPKTREYYHGGIKYKEVSFLFDNKVHHVQTATDMEPHFTVFDWISPDEYRARLSPYFMSMEEEVDGPSSMWYCWR
jgi:ubiquinone/menaquinone biosynthesis C-methylase UbiE